MNRTIWRLAAFLAGCTLSASAMATPRAELAAQKLTITAHDYRLTLHRFQAEFALELRDRKGEWRSVTRKGSTAEFAIVDDYGVHSSQGSPCRLRYETVGKNVVVGLTMVLPGPAPTIGRVDFFCNDDGILLRFVPEGKSDDNRSTCWAIPRVLLDEKLFDGYAYWKSPETLRSGRIVDLGDREAYAGISTWGNRGDTASRLSTRHPAVIARSGEAGVSLGVVQVGGAGPWTSAQSFLQRYDAHTLYLYPGIAPQQVAARSLWAWLAPLPADPKAAESKVARLAESGQTLAAGFRSIAPEPEEYWTKNLPNFPATLRHARPVDDVQRAIVYTMNEAILSEEGLTLARKAGSDMLIRAWFKWSTPPDYSRLAWVVPRAHALGALFGGGITCSALYHGENGLTDAQVLDMATRGPAGQLIAAWNEPNCRHGSLSSPAYLDYLLSSCKTQIEAGADYLFMDEISAALQDDEGFDDHSIAAFQHFLVDRFSKRGWSTSDRRWRERFQIDLADRAVAHDGTMTTFQYRAYLKARGLSTKPHSSENPMAAEWHAFRDQRDDRAWKKLTDAIRAHAATKGRRVLISANGLARYVDLQVLGVWGNWKTTGGRVDLSESQLEDWSSTVIAGQGLAGRKLPVVLFHDWGFGGFPWMEISPDDRKLWMRVRGAEIYAAGGFFAFPVQGPFGNNAQQDGTLAEVARQSAFYHQHENLYLDAEVLGFDPLETDEPLLSLALWKKASPASLLLHVINRKTDDGKIVPREKVALRLPVDRAPLRVRVVSPDWPDEQPGSAHRSGNGLTVELPRVEAYSVAILDYETLPEVRLHGRRIVPAQQWGRPARDEFVVEPGGLVRDQWALPGMLQGKLHQELRNPPQFQVNMPRGGTMQIHVRGVATLGARLVWTIDGKAEPAIDLPDRDGKNDAPVPEYDQTFSLTIPAGRHTISLDNVGGDWACIGWYAFAGEIGSW